DVHLVHAPAAGVAYVTGSGSPAEPVQTTELDWRHAFLPPGGVTVTYRVQLTAVGHLDLGPAEARFVDGDGVERRLVYPPLAVDVTAPVIRSFFLPVLYRNQCLPAFRHADVALVLDNSNSMLDEGKLSQAV